MPSSRIFFKNKQETLKPVKNKLEALKLETLKPAKSKLEVLKLKTLKPVKSKLEVLKPVKCEQGENRPAKNKMVKSFLIH